MAGNSGSTPTLSAKSKVKHQPEESQWQLCAADAVGSANVFAAHVSSYVIFIFLAGRILASYYGVLPQTYKAVVDV